MAERSLHISTFGSSRTVSTVPWPAGEPQRVEGAVVVAGDWHVLLADGRAMLNPAAHKLRSGPAKGEPKTPQAELVLTGESTRVPGAALLIGGYGNYYHALTDYLINWFYVREGGAEGRSIIVSPDLQPFERAIMAFLGIPNDRVVQPAAEGLILIDDLLILPRAVRGIGKLVDPRAPAWLRERALAGEAAPSGRRLYVSRARAKKRGIANEADVIAALLPMGFEPVHLEDLPFSEQASLFAGADIVVGPHGAGLANLLFMRPGASLVEIMPSGPSCPRYYERLATSLGIRFERVQAGPLQRHAKGTPAGPLLRTSFEADPRAIVEAVAQVRT